MTALVRILITALSILFGLVLFGQTVAPESPLGTMPHWILPLTFMSILNLLLVFFTFLNSTGSKFHPDLRKDQSTEQTALAGWKLKLYRLSGTFMFALAAIVALRLNMDVGSLIVFAGLLCGGMIILFAPLEKSAWLRGRKWYHPLIATLILLLLLLLSPL